MSHLAERGYEPHLEGTAIRLRNCPFQVVAGEFPVLACGMNLALLEGVLDGAGLSARHTAQMEPRAGECCVALVSKTNQD
jgi:predicted ArsR family transcriptional regulator